MPLPVPSRIRTPAAVASFLGRGWSFPPTFSRSLAAVALVAGEEDIRQSLFILLGTAPGERLMLPTYGCDLARFLFTELNSTTLTEMEDVVSTAILRWEPRIDLLHVAIDLSADQPGLVLIKIDYRIRRTNARTNLVYPFYIAEATLAGEI